MRRIGVWALAALVPLVIAVLPASSSAGTAAAPARVTCPVAPGVLPSGGDVQWAFSDSAAPQGARSSYVHGRGNWTAGTSTGTGCTADALRSGGGTRDLVLGLGGSSKLAGRVTESGLLGVRLVLPVRVRASSDRACPVGTTGTFTMFASYYATHRDSAVMHFASACHDHNFTYAGSGVHVYIARHGAQVNTP